MRRPLLIVAICLCVGIIFADRVQINPAYLFVAAYFFLLLAMIWAKARPWLVAPAVFFVGAVILTLNQRVLSPDDLRAIIGEEAGEISLRGQIIEAPYQRYSEHDHTSTWRTLTQLEVQFIRSKDSEEWSPATGTILVSTRDILPESFCAGRHAEVSGVIRRPKSALAPGLFDYREYLRRLGIHYQLFASSAKDWSLLTTSTTLPISERFNAWAKRTLALGLSEEDENLRLLWAMTLGWKTALSGEVSEPFMRSGTMHVFAISGLHIALIAGILVATLKMAGLRRPVCAWIVIPIIWAYTGITGWQASAIRSTIMSTVIILGWSLRRPSDLLNSLAVAAILILVWDPQQLFQASFQLSFCVVLSLALFTPVFERYFQKRLAPDSFLPRQLRPKWQRWLHWPVRFITSSFGVSLAAWLGSAPLIAYYFHLFTPISLVANIIVVPLSSAALVCNVASIAIGWFLPPAAELLNNSAWLWMDLMVRISQWAADVKVGVLPITAPNLSTFVLYYLLLAGVITGWLWQRRKWIWSCAAIAPAFVIWAGIKLHERSLTVLTVLPLEGGSAVHIKLPNAGEDWLIDCGGEQAARWTTKPFLQAQGLSSLSHFILTHGDVRHVGAAELIHRLFPPGSTYVSPLRFRSRPYQAVLQALESNHIAVTKISDGDKVGAWQVLHPASTDKFSHADDGAMVLFGEVYGKGILLLADLSKVGQNALLNRHPGLRADIVVTGLPSFGEPVMDGFLDVVRPELIIVTDAEYPAKERASPALKARLARRKTKVIYSSESGAVTLSFGKTEWRCESSWPLRLESPKTHAEILARY